MEESKDIITKNETSEEVKEVKLIQANSMPIDHHLTELPLFLNNKFSKVINDEARDKAKMDSDIKQIKDIHLFIDNDGIEKRVFQWFDNKNLERKLFMYNAGRLPREFEQDVYLALQTLFMRKNAPFFQHKDGYYIINVDKVYFTFYEIAQVMKCPPTGAYIKKIKGAITTLKTTQYFSYLNGVFYDKSNNSYIISKERGLSLIADYDFLTAKKTKDMTMKDLNWVQFSNFVINNLKYHYFWFLTGNQQTIFELDSGLAKSIFMYLDKNRYDSNGKPVKYIKRYYDTFTTKVPIDYKYPSELKRRLEKPLKQIIEKGQLKDYFYGDEVKINGKYEDCIYFCYASKDRIIDELDRKYMGKQLQFQLDGVKKDDKPYLKMPTKDLILELEDREINKIDYAEVVGGLDKWSIIKCIIWIDKKEYEKSIDKNKGGYLRFALSRMRDSENNESNLLGQEIIDFVETEKKQLEEQQNDIIKTMEEKYDEYINDNIEMLKSEEPSMYKLMFENLYSNMKETGKKVMQQLKSANGDTSKWEEFYELGVESEWFKEAFIREIRLYKKLMNFQEFYIENNNTMV
jgi:hypothetical protein